MSAYSDLVASHGAVHYWRLGETAGTSAIDSIGGATGTLTGAVTLNQPGAITDGTPAMGFVGHLTDPAIGGRISTGVFTTIPQPLTLELWVKTTDAVERAMASARDTTNVGGRILLGVLAGALRDYYDVLGSYANGTRSLADGQWHHVVWVFVGSSPITAYVDGTVETLTPAQTTHAAFSWDRITIGYEPVGGAKAWTGSLDEVAIYPRALTPAEITQHYTVGTTASVSSVGCDHTTVWAKHLDTINAPKVEHERAYLSGLYVQPGGQDMSYLVSRWLQAINCGAVATTPSAPTLSVVTPNTGTQGTIVTVTITGTNFIDDATSVTVSGTGVVVGNIQVQSPTTLTADLAIDAGATAAARTLTVTTAGGTSTTQPFTVAAPGPVTAYANPGGAGDRTAQVVVTVSAGLLQAGSGGHSPYLVNGNLTETVSWFTSSVAGSSIEFWFPSKKIITEAKYYQSDTTTHGVWQWQASNDRITWTAIGATLALGGATPFQTQTTLAANSTAYLFYRLVLISGTTSSSSYIQEFEFKIVEAGTTSYLNPLGSGNRTALITQTVSGITFSGAAPSTLLDGTIGADVLWWDSNSNAGHWLRWDLGAAYVVQDMRFWMAPNYPAQGDWKFQGSPDGTAWTDLSSALTLGGTFLPVTRFGGFEANATAYRYYRLLGVSGARTSSPYQREVEFMVGA